MIESFGISVKLPIIVRIDNIGAVFMAENASSGVRTRHIDALRSLVLCINVLSTNSAAGYCLLRGHEITTESTAHGTSVDAFAGRPTLIGSKLFLV